MRSKEVVIIGAGKIGRGFLENGTPFLPPKMRRCEANL